MRSTTEVLKSLEMTDRRYWIGVVSASHVNVAVEGGFAQLCHGKSAMLRQMSAGDWMIYYSPRTDISTGKPLQAFTAIGQIIDDRVYQYQMSESFVPFRRDLRYLLCREVKIATLLDQLSFTRGNRNWGFPFRNGHFEIGAEDFRMIASSMLENEAQSLLDISLSHKC
ncbi:MULTISPECIES: EVE domain-containing protein [Paenibacillus]|uniref:EVE domain-containing protein n=1 Tax=Paenibacillus TaxID=44249 RepID=UPI00088AF137|nr:MULTISPECIES: EVE domain-containing protein [Paenibacillus]SDC24753.1 EVE domain-containing protein [Paenibacillus sp. CF095]